MRLRVGRPARGSSWLPAPPRATRSAPMAWALRAPRGLRQPDCCLALRARNRRRGRCTPRRLHVPILRIVSWGWWGCRRRRALRASREALCKACFELLPRARMGLHAARTSLPPPPPRLSGAPARWLTARGRRASGFAAAQRPRAAGAAGARAADALWEACAACSAIQTAWVPGIRGKRLRPFTSSWLPSELGKYLSTQPESA